MPAEVQQRIELEKALLDKKGRERGRFSPVEIVIGRQSISRVVLDSRLAAGDVIALRDPTEKRALGPAASGGEAGK